MIKISFPQANNLNTLFFLLQRVPIDATECFNIHSASQIIKMSERQGKYYLDTLRFLELITKISNDSYILNENGKKIVEEQNNSICFLHFISYILRIPEINKFYKWFKNQNEDFSDLMVTYIIHNYKLEKSTAMRRSQAIAAWCKNIDLILSSFACRNT